jgi:hypothetical protein
MMRCHLLETATWWSPIMSTELEFQKPNLFQNNNQSLFKNAWHKMKQQVMPLLPVGLLHLPVLPATITSSSLRVYTRCIVGPPFAQRTTSLDTTARCST